MTSPVFTLAEIELPVLSAAILAGLGWLIRQSMQTRKEQRHQLDMLKKQLSSLVERIALNRENYVDLRKDVDGLLRVVPQIRENVAVLAAGLEHHEEWHERGHGNAVRSQA
jgi:chromosome segregation ATPase